MRKYKQIIILSLLFVILINCSVASADQFTKLELIKATKAGEGYLIEDYKRFQELKKPVVGLALGGGGARAFVNIGVIKALEESKVPIDLIVGTSMGAIVGTMYGSGLSIEQVEDIVIQAPLPQMFDINFGSYNSLLNTVKVNKFIENIAPHKRLENFPIPTALLSFDLSSGNKYLSTTGEIADVIQSSYAIPFYFPIHQKGERFLVDPGIVEMTPAKAAKLLGSDLVIATTAFNELPYNVYDSPLRSTVRYLTLMQQRNADQIIANYSDVVIKNNVGEYSFMDFQLAAKLIEIGYRTTKQKLPKIKRLLKEEKIKLKEPPMRKQVDISQPISDLKYERQLLTSRQFAPLFYYGKNHSQFNQTLLKTSLWQPQYGFKYKRRHLELFGLANKSLHHSYELKFRWCKLTSTLDLIVKTRHTEMDTNDWKAEIKYYQPNYTVGAGTGRIKRKDFIYINNQYNFSWPDLTLVGETDLIYPTNKLLPQLLTTQEVSYKLSDIWTIKPRWVFNSTDLIASPIIYRGVVDNKDITGQLNINFMYTYDFLHAVKVMNILQLQDIDFYLFSDYKTSNSTVAYGVGSNFDFNLLGLEPIDLGVYSAYDQEEKSSKLGWQLNYNF